MARVQPCRAVVTVHCDTREPKSIRMMVSAATNGDITERASPADYTIFCRDGCVGGIVRKAGDDLTGSLSRVQKSSSKKHLFDELDRLVELGWHRIMVIENQPKYHPESHTLGHSMWHHGAVQMILGDLMQDGVLIYHTDSPLATADLLRILNNRARVGCVMPRRRTDDPAKVASSAA